MKLPASKILFTCLTLIVSTSVQAQTTPSFAYFVDNFTAENIGVAVPAGTILIGGASPTQRSTMTSHGRIVGASAGVSSAEDSKVKWRDAGSTPDLHALFNSATAPDLSTPAARQTFAQQIITAAVLDSGFPSASEATETLNRGYVLWAQDIEGPVAVPQETAAAIIALMWAGREILGSNMKIIPVPASALQKTTASTWDLKSTLEGNTSDNFVKFLNLKSTLSLANQASLDSNSMDLLSALHLLSAEGHSLIDGILAQQYSASGCNTSSDCPTNCVSVNCEALPGIFSNDTPHFFDTTLPYAIMSVHDCPSQLFLSQPVGGCPGISNASAPWKSYYRGNMPFQAGIYWNQTTIDPATTFQPANYLVPTLATSGGFGGGEFCPADLDGNRRIDGSDLAKILGYWGPVAANHPADFNADGDVNSADMSILFAAWGDCPLFQTSNWIKVLIAQEEPPADQQTYVNKIKKLAPALDQIHLRFTAGATNYQAYANLITLLRTAYGSTLKIGFHPDNSTTSCNLWGCTNGGCAPTSSVTWQCVLDKSIAAMNAINLIADPNKSGRGFNIFSLEQSSVEDVTTAPTDSLAAIKSCMQGNENAIPGVRAASPPVTLGNVGPSYGGQEIYGTTHFDFGYPQMYNLGKNLSSAFSTLVTASPPYFPAYSATSCIAGAAFPYKVVDVDSNAAYSSPKIPCFGPNNAPNVYTYNDPPNSGPNPILTAAYVAFLMTQYPPVSNTVALNGSEVFMMFSGEPEFLGYTGWTLDKIEQFNQQLNTNFTYLKTVPGLIPIGATDPLTMQYGIWNFASILDQITLP